MTSYTASVVALLACHPYVSVHVLALIHITLRFSHPTSSLDFCMKS
jgi:hypothetical protein